MDLSDTQNQPDVSRLAERVLYKDADMLVLNKPSGIAVHPGSGRTDSLEPHFSQLRFELKHSPALAHRLDRETSGCLLLGRHKAALAHLGHLFASGQIEKTYWALVHGKPTQTEGTIDLPLSPKNPLKGWHMRVDPLGLPAQTDYRVLGAADDFSWLELKPRTGRTHQLRLHCAAMGHPILGDRLYGGLASIMSLLNLHAQSLAIPMARATAKTVQAPPPPHMEARLRLCSWRESV